MSGSVTPYLSLITAEHNQRTDFLACITTLTQPLADQQAVTNGIAALYNLDTAVGSQLDTVGQWIGVTRYLSIALADVYFSFDVVGLGFDQGAWAPNGGATVLTALPDDEYRLLLYAKVAENHWDGTIPGAQAALNLFWNPQGYYEYVIDNQDMTMSFLLIGPPLNAVTAALYYNGLLDLIPAGVGVVNHFFVEGSGGVPFSPIFGFDMETPLISGFDVGYWDGSALGLTFTTFMQGTGMLTANLPAPVVPDGSFAIFALGGVGVFTTNQYTYSGATVGASTNLLTGTGNYSGGAGNSTQGLFPTGSNTNTTNLFTYSGFTVTASTNFTQNLINGTGTSISTEAIICMGGGFPGGLVTNLFTYSGASMGTSTSLALFESIGASASNSTTAIIALGYSNSNFTNTYTYSGAVVASGTNMAGNMHQGGAAGNNTIAYIANGLGGTAVDLYTYSGATFASSSALISGFSAGAASGNSVEGVFAIGASTATTNTITYSGDTVTSSTNLTGAAGQAESNSNGITGVTI